MTGWLRCPVCGFRDVGETGTCQLGHEEVDMDPVSADEAYIATQGAIASAASLLASPLFEDLDAFIARAERSLAVGPVFHPSEFQAGIEQLNQVIAHARALRHARNLILEAST